MAFAVAVLAVLATVAPEQAVAQAVTTFISNTGQTSNDSSTTIRATAFTTGTGTYTVSSVDIYVDLQSMTSPPTPVVQIYGDASGNPGSTLVATMNNPGTITDSAVNTFTAPANTMLSASTTYWVVTSNSAATNRLGFQVGTISNTTLDSGTAAGWSIGNARFKNNIANTTWASSSNRLRFAILGTGGTTNTPATGVPTITGTPTVGQTLTAATSAIMDDDGLTTPGYTYQWIRVATDNTETNIASATANTYTLVTDDLGTTIKVKVSFTDDASNAETLTSVATAAVAADTTPPTLVSAEVSAGGGRSYYRSRVLGDPVQ